MLRGGVVSTPAQLLWGLPMDESVGHEPWYRGAMHCSVIQGSQDSSRRHCGYVIFCFLFGSYHYLCCLESCIGLGKRYLWFNSLFMFGLYFQELLYANYMSLIISGLVRGYIFWSGFQCVRLLFWFLVEISSGVLGGRSIVRFIGLVLQYRRVLVVLSFVLLRSTVTYGRTFGFKH